MGYLNDFVSLIFPHICLSCNCTLVENERTICTYCLYKLPQTNFHLQNDNPIEKIFWGRTNVHSAAAFYSFSKGGNVQQLIHNLKYKGMQELGVELGRLYGFELIGAPRFSAIDVIVPVPLHPTKKSKRGYNQSELIAEGLSLSMKKPSDFRLLIRNKNTDTQTKNTRFNRWKNVDTIFSLRDTEQYKSKHILVVDDVITTGATLESCINTLLQIEGVKVSVATIAWAGK